MGLNYKTFTLGVEEEYMVLDPTTFELKSHQQQLVQEGQQIFKDKVKAEMHQAVVEVGTSICKDADEAYQEVATLRKTMSQIAKGCGFAMGAAGTHLLATGKVNLLLIMRDTTKSSMSYKMRPEAI
jgi:carboxylate-amine ligase